LLRAQGVLELNRSNHPTANAARVYSKAGIMLKEEVFDRQTAPEHSLPN